MADLLLTTLNAKYAHAAFGLRYLFANLGPLKARAELLEFEIADRPVDILEALLARSPKVIGFGVYIWNVDATTRLVADLKRLRPETTVVLGGPEVSYETETQEIVALADYVVTGEADLTFPRLCQQLFNGERPAGKILAGELPQLAALELPYGLYTDHDAAHRVIYVEASRGCPYECEFCLSSLEIPVRQFALEPFLAAMQGLLDRGVTQFKFVDRTFNLTLRVSRQILAFFLERYRPGLFLHFEMVPDRLPEPLRDLIAQFPAGALQFEVGIQSFDERVSTLISRRQDVERIEQNLTWLREQTGVHVHADLIVGLPGETEATFARGFDRLVRLQPQEIQVGLLKRLRGTPIIRHDAEWGMVYSASPPYEVLATRTMDFQTVQKLRRFSRYWDLVANSGNFRETAPLLWAGDSPYVGFLAFSEWLFARTGQTHAIALKRLAELLFVYLTTQAGLPAEAVALAVYRDYVRGGRSDRPEFLRPYASLLGEVRAPTRAELHRLPRQARHSS